MGLGLAFGCAGVTIVAMFVLLFVLAGVEERMFNQVMVTPDADEAPAAPDAATLDTAPELTQAA